MPKTHSVERDITEFCGWDRLLEIADKAGKIKSRVYSSEFLQALVAALFETGGRVSEVLSLKPENFDLGPDPDFVIVKGMLVLKRKKKGKAPILGSGIPFRSFPIKRTDPLWPYLERWIKKCKPGERLFPISRSKTFLLVRGLGKDLYPHWFRSQRASQLAFDYGWGVGQLMEFFAWTHMGTALKYTHHGWKGLAEAMRS